MEESSTFRKLLLLLLLTTLVNTAENMTENVVMVVEMTRHGARAPLSTIYPREWIDKVGNGELTDVGMRQHYISGMNTQMTYKQLFENELQRTEYYLRSTDVNRTLMSAYAHMIGLQNQFIFKNADLPFEANDSRNFPPQKLLFNASETDFTYPLPQGMSPFPFHTTSLDEDFYLGLDGDICPANQRQIDADKETVTSKLKDSASLKQALKEGMDKYNLTSSWQSGRSLERKCYLLGDFAIMDYLNNPEPLIDPTSELYKKLEWCYWLGISDIYMTEKTAQVTSTPALESITKWFHEKSFHPKTTPLKYVLLSAHDDTLAAFLTPMGILNSSCLVDAVNTGTLPQNCSESPPVASSIIWELVNKTDGFYTRVKYNGVYNNYCGTGTEEDGFLCKLSKFNDMVKTKYGYPEYKTFCEIGVETTVDDKSSMILIQSLIIVGLIIVSGVLILLNIKKNKQE